MNIYLIIYNIIYFLYLYYQHNCVHFMYVLPYFKAR